MSTKRFCDVCGAEIESEFRDVSIRKDAITISIVARRDGLVLADICKPCVIDELVARDDVLSAKVTKEAAKLIGTVKP